MKLTDVPGYVYGTTRLGDENIPIANRVAIARAAIDSGAWLHTSDQYGSALSVLNSAFDVDRSGIPPTIFKIGWESVEQVRSQIESQLAAVGLERMAIGQLCPGGQLAEDFRKGGPCYKGLQAMKDEGLVGRFVLETWPWTSQVAIDALKGGHSDQIIDGYIFYLNPLQRFVTNELWDLIQAQDKSVVAMRTVAGGDVYRIRENGPDYLRKRAEQMIPISERSGAKSWPEFCVRFVYGIPQVRTTVGATARKEALGQFLEATRNPQPLPMDIQEEILALQRRWSDEHDRFAEPWSM